MNGWGGKVTHPSDSLPWLKTWCHLSWTRHLFHTIFTSYPPWVLPKVDSAYYTQLHQQSLHLCSLPENAFNMQSTVSGLAAFDLPSHYPTISPHFIRTGKHPPSPHFNFLKKIFKAWLTPVSTQWRKTIPTSSSTTHHSTYADNKSKDAIQNSPRPALSRFSNT